MIKLWMNVHAWTPPSDREQKPVSYKVRKVTGSTQYWPGQILPKAAVEDMCAATGTFQVNVEEAPQ